MKKLILGVVALAAIPSMSMAQEAAAPAPWSNAYVNVTTGLEGTADWTLGSEVNLAGVGGYAQLTYKDRIEADAVLDAGGAVVTAATGDDYAITLGSSASLGMISLNSSVSYEWGTTSGADLIGRGAGNTWGDLTSTTTAKVSPGLIGGEYVWLGANMNVASAGEIDLGWGGATYGVGYKHDLNERAYVTASYGWDVSVVDDGDDTTVNDWVTEASGMKIGVGFKF
jgi:hypothetical protein